MDEASKYRKLTPPSAPWQTRGHHLRQPVPYARSILWQPVADMPRPTVDEGYPIFIAQQALAAVHEHLATAPHTGVLGFLLGDLFECPDTLVRYLVIDSTIRVRQVLLRDETLRALTRVSHRIGEELEQGGRELLGWYHSHPPLNLSLSPDDLKTQVQFFPEPWQVALIVGADQDGLVGGFIRSAESGSWASTCLPFYELLSAHLLEERSPRRRLEPAQALSEGAIRTHVLWRNYRTEAWVEPEAPRAVAPPQNLPHDAPPPLPPPLSTQSRPPPPQPPPLAPQPLQPLQPPQAPQAPQAPRPPQRPQPAQPAGSGGGTFFFPDEFQEELGEPVLPVPGAGGAGGAGRRWSRVLLYGALAVVVTVGLIGLYALFVPLGPQLAVTSPSETVIDPELLKLDRRADAVAEAVIGYTERARLFDNRQMDCGDLARGLVTVEDNWVAYNTQRRATTTPLDAGRAEKDQSLTTDVDGVERHFERSQCQRP